MKDKIKLFIIKLLQKVGEVTNKVLTCETEKRVTLGVSIVISSITYMYLVGDKEGSGVFPSIIGSIIFVIGLFIIVPDVDSLTKGFMKVCKEIIKIFFALLAIETINTYYTIGIYYLTCKQQAIFAVCVFIDILYVVSMAMCIFKIIKRLVDFIAQKISMDAVENKTKRINEIFKNLASIVGVLAVIYQFFKPMIESILGL